MTISFKIEWAKLVRAKPDAGGGGEGGLLSSGYGALGASGAVSALPI